MRSLTSLLLVPCTPSNEMGLHISVRAFADGANRILESDPIHRCVARGVCSLAWLRVRARTVGNERLGLVLATSFPGVLCTLFSLFLN
jgi:hypothetical protein